MTIFGRLILDPATIALWGYTKPQLLGEVTRLLGIPIDAVDTVTAGSDALRLGVAGRTLYLPTRVPAEMEAAMRLVVQRKLGRVLPTLPGDDWSALATVLVSLAEA